MRHLKIYESFNPIDPFDEENWNYVEPVTFYDWLKKYYTEDVWYRIDVINCSNKNIVNLEGIKNLPKLRRLDCSNNRLKHFDELKGFGSLETLNVDNNELTRISPVTSMKLKELSCRNNRFSVGYIEAIKSHCKSKGIKVNV